MTVSVDDILSLYRHRKDRQGAWAERAREVRDTYGGDVVVPLPEIERIERPAVANLTKMGLDQMGTRIASTLPDVSFPMRNAGIETQQKRSREKRQALYGWWDHNRLGLKMYRRGRWYLAYAKAPVVIRPDFKTGIPRWDLRDPLGCFEAPRVDREDPCVDNCIFAVKRSRQWLIANYPTQTALLVKDGRLQDADDLYDVLEYIDGDEIILAAAGRVADTDRDYANYGYAPSGQQVVELERMPNRVGYCTAIVPTTINLDTERGQFDGMIGLYQQQSRLMALEVIAVEKGIFPDEWLVGDAQGSTPEIVQVADGRTGRVGMVRGGQLRQQQLQPGYQTLPTIDRLERGMRLGAGIPAEFGGESTTNVRTGRRGENILSATIDFTIQEAQQIFASSLEAENRCAINVAKAYHDGPTSFYVSWRGSEGFVDYTPSKLFDSDQNVVSYAQAGSDVNSLVIAAGQRVGIGTMSKRKMMELDPLIDDPELESDRIVSEGLQQALLGSIEQMTSQGQIPPGDVARIIELVESNQMDLAQAVLTAQREAQERQAAQVPPGAPEAQPGLAAPGAGAEAGLAIPEGAGGASVGNLADLLTSLRRPQMALPSEAGPGQVAV